MLVTYIPSNVYFHPCVIPTEVTLDVTTEGNKTTYKARKKGDNVTLMFNKDCPNLVTVLMIDKKTRTNDGQCTLNLATLERTYDIAERSYYYNGILGRLESLLLSDLIGENLGISIPVLKLSGFLSKDFSLVRVLKNSKAFADAGKQNKISYDHLSEREIYAILANRYSGLGMDLTILGGKEIVLMPTLPEDIEVSKKPEQETTIDCIPSDRSLANRSTLPKLDSLEQGLPETIQPETQAETQADKKIARLTRNRTRAK